MIADKQKFKDAITSIAAQKMFLPWMVEKDFYMTVIVHHIDDLSDKLVLRGGVLINKVYFDNYRLSQDLDFKIHSRETLSTRVQRSGAIAPIKEKMGRFLKTLSFKTRNPEGEEIDGHGRYRFILQYHSCFTEKDEDIELDINSFYGPLEEPQYHPFKHFYKDTIFERDLMQSRRILSLSFNEMVAEKVDAIEYRPFIKDHYDLWQIAKSGFDFYQDDFTSLLRKKYDQRYGHGGCKSVISLAHLEKLNRQKEDFLYPLERTDERFYIDGEYKKMARIFSDQRFHRGWGCHQVSKLKRLIFFIKDRMEKPQAGQEGAPHAKI